jgi:hypothetical protein
VNGADGISDIEGKVARVSDEGDGKRPSFKSVAKLMPVRLEPRQFEFEMRFRSVKGAWLPTELYALDHQPSFLPFACLLAPGAANLRAERQKPGSA